MHCVVCVKHVPDPEAPWAQFRIDAIAQRVAPLPGVRWLMSPFDAQALEAALSIRDQLGQARITAITLGDETARATLKQALAMGADDAVLVDDRAFDAIASDASARVLAATIAKLGTPDLVFTGRQAADTDAGIVGGALAELLDRPLITFVAEAKVENERVQARRVVENGFDLVEASLPAVLTVSNEIGAARVPNLRETMRAARKPVVVWSAADLALGPIETVAIRERLFEPERVMRCELIEGASPQAQAAALAARLRDARLLAQ